MMRAIPIARTRLHKARRSETEQRIRRLIQRLETPVREAFLAAVERLRSAATLERLAEALEAGNIEAVLRILDIGTFERALHGIGSEESLTEALREAFRAGAAEGRAMLPPRLALEAGFDLLNQRSVDFLRSYEFRLIREIGDETRETIRQVVMEAFLEGGHPRDQARRIRDIIGLTEKQARAVINFRHQLESRTNTPDGRTMQPAGARRLSAPERARAVRHIRQGGLTRRQIDDLVETYRRRLIGLRAQTIARTETIRASNAGIHEQWRQAAEQGLLDPQRTRRRWITAGDDRVRPTHRQIPGMNPQGVGLNEPFRTPDGPVLHPPAAPNCRCAVVLDLT